MSWLEAGVFTPMNFESFFQISLGGFPVLGQPHDGTAELSDGAIGFIQGQAYSSLLR